MRNEGVTILQVVITIIIMIIIMSVVVLYGNGVSKEAKIAAVYNEIREIESALKEARILGEIKLSGDSINIFNEINIDKVNATEYSTVLSGENTRNYYYLDFTSSRKLENVLGLENVKNDYLFDFENLNIYIIKGLDITETVNIDGKDTVVDVTKYDSDEIVEYYNNTFVK